MQQKHAALIWVPSSTTIRASGTTTSETKAEYVSTTRCRAKVSSDHGERRELRHVMLQATLVASHHNLVLKAFAYRLRAAERLHKVVITAVARKLDNRKRTSQISSKNGPVRTPEK